MDHEITQGNADALHQALVDTLKNSGYISSPSVETAFRAVPRHLFLPGIPLNTVYSDRSIPTKQQDGMTLSSSSQPAIMAVMLEDLALKHGHHVLEIGAGTGYNAALMAHIVGRSGRVVTVDIDDDIVSGARASLATMGAGHVQVVCNDGADGYPVSAPYDRIIVTAGAGDIASEWRNQLKPGGRLMLPLSIHGVQKLVTFQEAGGRLDSIAVRDCGFLPLRGAQAQPEIIVPLGPDPGLHVTVHDPTLVDVNALYRMLRGPSTDWTTTMHVTVQDMWGGLGLWLAIYESALCTLSAMGDVTEHGLVPNLFGPAHTATSCRTIGLLDNGSLCVLMRAPQARVQDEVAPFELYIRCFGENEQIAQRLMARVKEWECANRPSTADLRITAYSQNMEYAPQANESIATTHTAQLVLKWSSASQNAETRQ